ncbi:Hypothetical protein NTJ_10713 [Nesidiocoris tenuis]|uniref:Uncharacterized protein n=1 Tax=Nesidiocoris tenuis TaxID=355587 RepID=A0ABN7B0F5_9HEMI|nr:Hypothetical protein NTJ_10713 [Nesidiocoris tenuis]
MLTQKFAVYGWAVLVAAMLLSNVPSSSAELKPAAKPPKPPPPPPIVTFGTRTPQLPRGAILVPLQRTRQPVQAEHHNNPTLLKK